MYANNTPILEFLQWMQNLLSFEFLRIIRRSSDFGVLGLLIIFLEFLRWAQTLRIWSFCVLHAEPPILEYKNYVIIYQSPPILE